MTNPKRQKALDKAKWLQSEQEHADLSGKQGYCSACPMAVNQTCTATQAEREKESLCAKAYNRQDRRLRSKK